MDLSFEPPEPPGADWPDFVRLSYGYHEGLPDPYEKSNSEAYPNGHLGWLVRMGYHLITRLDEQTPRVSDEAVVGAAVLYDLEVERSLSQEDEIMEVIDTLKGRLLERLRTCQLPTGSTMYSDEEALSVLRRWSEVALAAHVKATFVLSEYLATVQKVVEARGQRLILQLEPTPSLQVRQVTLKALQLDAAGELRRLADQIERGELDVTELQRTQRGRHLEWRIQAQQGVESQMVTLPEEGL